MWELREKKGVTTCTQHTKEEMYVAEEVHCAQVVTDNKKCTVI